MTSSARRLARAALLFVALIFVALIVFPAWFASNATLGGESDKQQPPPAEGSGKTAPPPADGGAKAKDTPPAAGGAQDATPPATGKKADAESDPKAIEIVERYLTAIGGRESLALLKDKTMLLINKKFEPANIVEMRMSRYMKGQYKVREQWVFPGVNIEGMAEGEGLSFDQVYDGEKGWVKTMGYVQELDARGLSTFVWDKYLDDPLAHWKEDGYVLKYRGEAKVDDLPVHKVDMIQAATSTTYKVSFRQDDGLLLKKEFKSEGPEGPEEKEVFMSDYTKIPLQDQRDKWISFALRERIFTNGELDLEKEYTEIRLNSGIDDSFFAKPAGQDFDEKNMPSGKPAPGKNVDPPKEKGKADEKDMAKPAEGKKPEEKKPDEKKPEEKKPDDK